MEVVATFVGIFLYFIPFKNIFDFVMILVNKVTNKYRNPKIITKLTPTRFRAECNDGIILFRGHFVALTVHFPPWWIMAARWIIASISRVDICKNCFGNLLKRSHWGLALVLIWSMTGTFCCPLGYRCDFRCRWHYYCSFYKKNPYALFPLRISIIEFIKPQSYCVTVTIVLKVLKTKQNMKISNSQTSFPWI